eukprot:TRINITY_DN15818_c0_g1_i1.p1 TRINITY_DN15818_c0_g1~~TRINITY_DN15818_c0_g1_i1.p1  ORF type:complete len:335 (-),score=63.28 TRINITY_DN15818_c0_g1_i1:35-1039(-)
MAELASATMLRICQFNVLAPSARICKPLDRIPWQTRHRAIVDMLRKIQADIVALQEFEFDPVLSEEFSALYTQYLGAEYLRYDLQRPGGKKEGLALLLRRSSFEDVSVQHVELEPGYCDRVAQVASLRHTASGRKLRVANTHLTVAHPSNEKDIPANRPLQMKQVLRLLDAESCDARFLCADMNCDHLETEDPAVGQIDQWGRSASRPFTAAEVSRPVEMAFSAGFHSALHAALQNCGFNGGRPVSHTSSYTKDGCVDYVFFRPGACGADAVTDDDGAASLKDAYLYPRELPPDTPWNERSGWGADSAATLSDHRPLVADFLLRPLSDGARDAV